MMNLFPIIGYAFIVYTLLCIIHFIVMRIRDVSFLRKARGAIETITLDDIAEAEDKDAHLIEKRVGELSPSARERYLERYTRITSIIKSLAEESRFSTLLDIGCGDGFLTSRLREISTQRDLPLVIGLDIALERLKLLKHRGAGTSEICADSELLPIHSASVDLVVCSEHIEHLMHPEMAISEIWRVLKPGGTCIASFPSRHPVALHMWNILSWIEFIIGLKWDSALIDFHNLYRRDLKNPSIHRAFSKNETQRLFRAFEEYKIEPFGISFPCDSSILIKPFYMSAKVLNFLQWVGQTIIFTGIKPSGKPSKDKA